MNCLRRGLMNRLGQLIDTVSQYIGIADDTYGDVWTR